MAVMSYQQQQQKVSTVYTGLARSTSAGTLCTNTKSVMDKK